MIPVQPPQIGPHEGRELELLLNGSKQIALFFSDYPELSEEYTHCLNQEILHLTRKIIFIDKNNFPLEAHIVHKNKNDPNVPLLIQLLMQAFSVDDKNQMISIERNIGKILGYDQCDIDFYIQKLEARLNTKDHTKNL